MTANQADLSLEYYYGRGNSFTVAGFYKAIKNGTYTSFYCPGSYNGVTLAGGSTNCTSANGGTDYSFSQVLNDSEVVHIRGVEVAWSQGFDQWLPFKGGRHHQPDGGGPGQCDAGQWFPPAQPVQADLEPDALLGK
jgi:outer membrane receptor protein involved in Fe transport